MRRIFAINSFTETEYKELVTGLFMPIFAAMFGTMSYRAADAGGLLKVSVTFGTLSAACLIIGIVLIARHIRRSMD